MASRIIGLRDGARSLGGRWGAALAPRVAGALGRDGTSWSARAGEVWRSLRQRRRMVWTGHGRAHVEARHLAAAEAEHFARAIEGAAAATEGVRWARYNAYLDRVVVAYVPAAFPEPTALVAWVEEVEARLGFALRPFKADTPDHPSDAEPLVRAAVALAADVLGLGMGLTLRSIRSKPQAFEIDLAALVSAFQNVPAMHDLLERRLGGAATEMLLAVAGPFSSGLVRGWSGPTVDALARTLRIREVTARRAAWADWEPLLCARPDDHPGARVEPPPRPAPLPPGPIERHAERAGFAALGGLGFGLATTSRFEHATASVFGGVPKPARLGQEAFAAHLGRVLARRGILTLRSEALRRLDRLDTLLVPERLLVTGEGFLADVVPTGPLGQGEVMRQAEALFDPRRLDAVHCRGGWTLGPLSWLHVPRSPELLRQQRALRVRGGRVLGLVREGRLVALVAAHPTLDPLAEVLVTRARRADLRLVVIGDDRRALTWARPSAWVSAQADIVRTIRAQQEDGHAVAFAAPGRSPGFDVADLGVCLEVNGEAPAWAADVLCRDGSRDLLVLIDAIGRARTASHHAVALALVDSAAGLLLTLRELKPRTLRSLMLVADTASFFAMVNAVRLAQGVRAGAPRPPQVRTRWHELEAEAVIERLTTSLDGLSDRAAAARQPPAVVVEPPWRVFGGLVLDELRNPLTPILAGGAGLAALVGSAVDGAVVGGVLGLNVAIGAFQRYRTEQLLTRFAQRERREVRVRRTRRLRTVDAADVVPGDILELHAGERVPADCRVLEASGLVADESSLTGESLPVDKRAEPNSAPILAERSSMLYAGTTVAAGRGVGVVVATGEDTEERRAARLGSAGAAPVGVEHRLERLTRLTIPVAIGSGLAVLGSGLARNRPPHEVVGAGVSLAVAAVPEGLPLLATVAQLAAARRLSVEGVLVRNPRAIEALGRIDVLCADKTGTLTEGKIRLRRVTDGREDAELDALAPPLRDVLATGLRASPETRNGAHLAHVTDRALFEGARRAGVAPEEGLEGWERREELPFEPERGFHAVLGRPGARAGDGGEGGDGSDGGGDGDQLLCLKGAPEVVVPRCARWLHGEDEEALDDAGRDGLIRHATELARRGLRVLAVADATPRGWDPRALEEGEQPLRLRGFLAFADPVRAPARRAIAELLQAGVAVKMITGDHPSTAGAIAAELGLLDDREVLTGAELERMDEAALDEVVPRTAVFARITPVQKARIVQSLQRIGSVVAMTGDGANDAPAIRLADVGIALGSGSTEAARDAADLVVTDERIEVLVHAVLEGRGMWSSVRDAVSILVGGNLGEIGYTVLGGLLEGRSPLNARQLLLVNLITDTLPALAVAARPPAHATAEELLREGPEASLGEALTRDVTWRAAVTAGAAWGAWLPARATGTRERADTVGLVALIGAQLGQTLVASGGDRHVLATGLGSLIAVLGIVETPGLSHFFGCRPLGPLGLTQALTATAVATGGSVLIPPAAARLSEWVQRSGTLERLAQRDWVRMAIESRVFYRLHPSGEEVPAQGGAEERDEEALLAPDPVVAAARAG